MSGKRSKSLRRKYKLSKKTVVGTLALLSAFPAAADGEFLVSLFPQLSIPVVKFDECLTTGYGAGLRFTYRPIQYFDVFLQGNYKLYSFDTAESVSNISVLDGMIGAGYRIPFTDRLSMNLNMNMGGYTSSFNSSGSDKNSSANLSGFTVGGGVSVSYKLNSVFSVDGAVSGTHYAGGSSSFISAVEIMPGITVNLSKAFSNANYVEMGQAELKPVFPVFYSWYNTNPFGSVQITNEEDVAVTDVKVYFYQPQYMSHPSDCGRKDMLRRGDSFSVELRAFFNEQMLSLNEKTDTMSTVIVEYKYLGQKRVKTFQLVVPVYGRNNMSWEDDRCASAFVSSKDPAAMWFAKYVSSTITENLRSGVPSNIQYAMGIFEALDQFGINYVKDPTSAFEDNVGTASIDFLQFPYQTLMYRGGDCDDLSILVCSLFEAVGIPTAFITIPGHIFMAFDSGLTVDQARNSFMNLSEVIVDNGKVWIPVEITLSDEGFNKAWHKGAWEWRVADACGNAMMYKMQDSWQLYKPVSVPGAQAKFTLPDQTIVAKVFSHSVDEFILAQISPLIDHYEYVIQHDPIAENYNDYGVLYAHYGLFAKAEAQFKNARLMEYLPAFVNTANMYYSMKDYERAKQWYYEVLKKDSSNVLAKIGIARCAYETGEYDLCDSFFSQVYADDRELAMEYSYLGAFESTSGRSFSLSDRLENTHWVRSGLSAIAMETSGSEKETEVTVEDFQMPAQSIEDFLKETAVALAPEVPEEKEEQEEDQKLDGDPEGDNAVAAAAESEPVFGESEPAIAEAAAPAAEEVAAAVTEDAAAATEEAPVIAESEPAVAEDVPAIAEAAAPDAEESASPETFEYTSLKDQLAFDTLSAEELASLASEAIEENEIETVNIDDIITLSEENQSQEELAAVPSYSKFKGLPFTDPVGLPSDMSAFDTALSYDPGEMNDAGSGTAANQKEQSVDSENILTSFVPVPRFTEQPSEEWAPKEAYEATTIPGMRSFEEEMGSFNAEKAWLQEDEFSFAINPGETAKEEKKENNSEAVLEINPFSSFLSPEDAKIVEQITSFSLPSQPETPVVKTAAEEVPVVLHSEVQPEPAKMPEIKKSEVPEEIREASRSGVMAALAAILAAFTAGAAVFARKKKRG